MLAPVRAQCLVGWKLFMHACMACTLYISAEPQLSCMSQLIFLLTNSFAECASACLECVMSELAWWQGEQCAGMLLVGL